MSNIIKGCHRQMWTKSSDREHVKCKQECFNGTGSNGIAAINARARRRSEWNQFSTGTKYDLRLVIEAMLGYRRL